jgi:hypothetical protein
MARWSNGWKRSVINSTGGEDQEIGQAKLAIFKKEVVVIDHKI